jgi:hypothetical protein
MERIIEIICIAGAGVILAALNVPFWAALIILFVGGFVYEYWKEHRSPPVPPTCPQCNNLESIITNQIITFADQVYRDVPRKDYHYYPDGKPSGHTVRYEQAKVPILKWDEISTCEHCGYEYSRRNEEKVGSPDVDINELKHQYGILKSLK